MMKFRKKKIVFVMLLMLLSNITPMFVLQTTRVGADQIDISPIGGEIPEPATEGFILDAYDTKKINITVNQSHFLFSNEYVNESLEHIDVFLPEELKDDIIFVTPCDPNLMVCQGEKGYFHILNDWTNEYSDRFYIETDYLFDYKQPHGDFDDDIPEGFGYTRINQNITMKYSSENTGIGDLLNTIVELDDSHSIQINVSSIDHTLILNYSYYYNGEITEQFEDNYSSYEPDIKEEISLKGEDESSPMDVKILKNESNLTLSSFGSNVTISLDKGTPTGWIVWLYLSL